MFEGQPKGLFALALANTGERFGYYTMLAVFALFLRANYGLDAGWAGEIYSDFLMLVYFLPIVGGWLADRFGFGRMVTIGILIMFAGYLLLSVPLGGDTFALIVMLVALVLIGFGTGLFKGNLQVMVGDLYNDPKYANKRDAGFSLFYMAINIGALFAPTAAVRIMEWSQQNLGTSVNDSYHFAFAIACASLILSIAIYYIFRGTVRPVEGGTGKADKAQRRTYGGRRYGKRKRYAHDRGDQHAHEERLELRSPHYEGSHGACSLSDVGSYEYAQSSTHDYGHRRRNYDVYLGLLGYQLAAFARDYRYYIDRKGASCSAHGVARGAYRYEREQHQLGSMQSVSYPHCPRGTCRALGERAHLVKERNAEPSTESGKDGPYQKAREESLGHCAHGVDKIPVRGDLDILFL